jgi:acetoin utilization protein AcuB
MLVRERMTTNIVTVSPHTSVPEALRLMRNKRIRRLPVLDGHGRLAGIVSDKDLLHASPSQATTLSVWEISELLAKITVEHVMTREVITVTDDTPLEEAARLMADRRIGGLPVMQGQTLAGIITETDLFKALLDMAGGRRPGVRITVRAPGVKGTLAKITNAIFTANGDVVGLGVNEIEGTTGKEWELMFKVQGVTKDHLVAALQPVVLSIQDVRESR